jgi:hypothetical protein
MQIAVHEFMLGIREALAIWLALVALAVFALVCLLAPDRLRRRRDAAREHRRDAARDHRRRETPAQVRRNRLATEAADLARYADEVAVAASRSAVTAQRRHENWVAAQRTQDATWRAFEAADTAARRVVRAAAFPVPSTPLTPSEFADRERYLHRAATEAYRRGELSVEQLSGALSHRNGWDPRRHPFEQEAVLRRAAQRRLLRVYQAASALERTAWHANEMAAVAKRSLDDEAFDAAERARQAGVRLAAGKPSRYPSARVVRRPTLATR